MSFIILKNLLFFSQKMFNQTVHWGKQMLSWSKQSRLGRISRICWTMWGNMKRSRNKSTSCGLYKWKYAFYFCTQPGSHVIFERKTSNYFFLYCFSLSPQDMSEEMNPFDESQWQDFQNSINQQDFVDQQLNN